MRRTVKFLLALAVALLLMLFFRALVFTIYAVGGNGLEPLLKQGDHVLVNRWSYGLRVGSSGGLFSYGRLGRQAVRRGDIVAFEDPRDKDQVLICRCKALPGDTITHNGQTLTVPGLSTCADANYYWMEALSNINPTDSRHIGFIPEELIIGRVVSVVYSHDPQKPFWRGWRRSRTLLPL